MPGLIDSTDFEFNPEMSELMRESRTLNMALWFEETYQPLQGELGTDVTAPNASVGHINAAIDAFGGPGPEGYIPEGYLDPQGDAFIAWGGQGAVRIPVGDLESYSAFDQIAAEIYGLFVWQNYKLSLALQVVKLSIFGRRGRPGGD